MRSFCNRLVITQNPTDLPMVAGAGVGVVPLIVIIAVSLPGVGGGFTFGCGAGFTITSVMSVELVNLAQATVLLG